MNPGSRAPYLAPAMAAILAATSAVSTRFLTIQGCIRQKISRVSPTGQRELVAGRIIRSQGVQ